MSELVKKVLGEIGKFELGINEWHSFRKERGLLGNLPNAIDLIFRYGFLAGELYGLATANHRSVLVNTEVLARAEVGKVLVHYFIKGMDYFTENLQPKLIRKMYEWEQPVTLNLSAPSRDYKTRNS